MKLRQLIVQHKWTGYQVYSPADFSRYISKCYQSRQDWFVRLYVGTDRGIFEARLRPIFATQPADVECAIDYDVVVQPGMYENVAELPALATVHLELDPVKI